MVLMGSNTMDDQLKTIKITETAHRALQLAKVLDGIKQQEWVSVVILEAMQRDCPKAYEEIRKQMITEE